MAGEEGRSGQLEGISGPKRVHSQEPPGDLTDLFVRFDFRPGGGERFQPAKRLFDRWGRHAVTLQAGQRRCALDRCPPPDCNGWIF